MFFQVRTLIIGGNVTYLGVSGPVEQIVIKIKNFN